LSLQAEVKHLTALVEDAARKNRALIAAGSNLSSALLLFFCVDWGVPQCYVPVAEAREKALAEAQAGYVKESLLREVEWRATEAEAAAKRAKSEVADFM
jgi:hypothetical protein